MERLRTYLGVQRWLVFGGSWGTTLGLAYAEQHPGRVSEIVFVSTGTNTRREVEWITRDMGRVFPEAWARFRDGVPPADRDGNLAAAYSRLLEGPDPEVRERAARDWCAWEDTHVATHPGFQPSPRYRDPAFRMGFARLVTHYWGTGPGWTRASCSGTRDGCAASPASWCTGGWTSAARRTSRGSWRRPGRTRSWRSSRGPGTAAGRACRSC